MTDTSEYLAHLGEVKTVLEDKGIFLSLIHLEKYVAEYAKGNMRPHFKMPAIPLEVEHDQHRIWVWRVVGNCRFYITSFRYIEAGHEAYRYFYRW